MTFTTYMRRFFYRAPPGDFFSMGKYFTSKIGKSHLEKEKKWKQLVRKTTRHAEKKLKYIKKIKWKNKKLRTKNVWFVYFWAGILKNYCHVSKQHSQICKTGEFGAKKNP